MPDAPPFDPRSITRPDPKLLTLYFWTSVATLLGFPLAFLAYYCRYRTLRYALDDEGVSMSVGVFFKREVNTAYRRIQDIHVSRGIVQRWLGLATVSIQTASGSAMPEIVIEGVTDADGLRDFLYQRMRGAKGLGESAGPSLLAVANSPADEALRLLEQIRDLLASRTDRDGREPIR